MKRKCEKSSCCCHESAEEKKPKSAPTETFDAPLPPQMNAQIDTPETEPVCFPEADSVKNGK